MKEENVLENFNGVQRLANCGEKIMIIELNDYRQSLKGLYKVGDVLTVKTLNQNFPRFPYGCDDGYHIKEVVGITTPEDIEILILPRQYVVLEEVS